MTNFIVHCLSKALAPLVKKFFLESASGLHNIPRVGPYILACNHIGVPDALVLTVLILQRDGRQLRFVARDDYWFSKWWVKIISRMFGVLLIDWRQPAAILDRAQEKLKNNEPIVIFPEGTRNFDQESLVLGKTGVARLALVARLPVIPVGYQGSSIRSLGRALKYFIWQRRRAIVNVGKPLDFSQYYNQGMSRELLYKITDQIMIAIGALCQRRPRLHGYL
ncbi:MAG: lysophospholipid acyltransferase family protein [Candidatus Komeilibacteria bacterium]|nr:lysophospholipid acyltransferase family protein [Candidatus Komeilibacteria bacterium]